ncbi:uncharacterized protein [Rutidosis leptorrhynchoides]|uniref:uncharacterized protein n=1 Tax=Rutidosis leptorrhynchoides TaxID=125765 RepID=UPI003A99DB34
MKILSYNIRGFGVSKDSKFGPIKKLILYEKPSFIALQETKLHLVNDTWVHSLWFNTPGCYIWGSNDCDFIQQEMIGKSGGQLLIWDSKLFEAVNVIKLDRVIGIRGKWKINGANLNVLNVYGPHDDVKKQILWDLLDSLLSADDEAWPICGDLNEVRDHTERFNCEFVASRARRFNDFILSNNLLDIPLGGRAYTRVSDDGTKFSKLDRFLVSEKFYLLWNNLAAVVLERRESDHCPIVLKDEEKNYGPKPFKIFDAWYEDESIEQVVSDAWAASTTTGVRKDRVFLNKLKCVKVALKLWSRQKFGQLDGEIETHKNVAQALEIKAESSLLNSQEQALWNNARKCWFEKENAKTSMLKQKARVRWALEGDENTKFFH